MSVDFADGRQSTTSPAMAWFTTGLLTLMYAFSLMDRQIMSLMVGPVRADLNITDFQLSLLHGMAFAVFYAIFGLPLGYLVDRMSRRTLIAAGMSVWSAATALCGVSQTYFQLLSARMAVGAGEATLNPAAYSILSDIFPKRGLTLALTVFACGGSIGGAASVALVGALLDAMQHMGQVPVPFLGELSPWRVVFIIVGVPGIIVALFSYAMPEPKRLGRLSGADLPRMGAVWGFIKSRPAFFTGHFIGFSFIHVFTYAMTAWLPTYVIRVFGWPIKDVALVLGACQLGSIPSMLILGSLIERRFQRGGTDAHFAFYSILILISAVIIGAAVIISDAWITIVLFAIALSWLGYAGIAGAAMQLVTPNEFRGQVSVTYLFVATLLGVGIGPSIPAAFTDFLFQDDMKVGWSMGLTAAIAAPISAFFLWRGRPAMRQAVADAQAWSSK